MAKRAPSPIDLEVGRRIRLYRVQAGLTQTDLGNALGVTFQQVQKYERAANRVGAGRLDQIARALKVPLTAFFDGSGRGAAQAAELSGALVRPYAMRLLKAFNAIDDERLSLQVIRLIEVLARPSEG